MCGKCITIRHTMSWDTQAQTPPPKNKRVTGKVWVRALFPVLLTMLASLLSLKMVCTADDGASKAQWKALATHLETNMAPNDLLVIAPSWLDPVGRQHLGPLMSIPMVARMDAASFSGVWEVSARGATAPETRFLRASKSMHFGDLTLRYFPQTPVVVRYDFRKHWRSARVHGAVQQAPRLRLEEVGFAPHQCIQTTPKAGKTVHMRFSKVPLGNTLVGYVGLADVFTRRDIRNPGALSLWINGEEKHQLTFGVDEGWKRFEVATTNKIADVEFRLTAVGPGSRNRRICFAAEARQ